MSICAAALVALVPGSLARTSPILIETIGPRGRMVHDTYLVEVEFRNGTGEPWDLPELVGEIPGADAFRPLNDSDRPLLKKS